ncbi:hypothetical protein BVC71_00495 [Marivivens niveibacter]|uniref:Carboxyltransferase domain-containing protein n=1 Tax=Marivivens niveibacter TaxID=1930667 RepID=A0A251WZW2_9RHOB|nr:carboxyltransferase domain-containing protein [Marivivens niveibacter]OUD10030.1 hypothetical protein BVC71_00495 [Marivivens niveibacter]
MVPQILPLGIDGALVRFGTVMSDEANQCAAQVAQILSQDEFGFIDVQGTLASVAVRFDPIQTNFSDVRAVITAQINDATTAQAIPFKQWRIPTCFNGEDLAEVAAIIGDSAQSVIDEIASIPVRVLTIGFAPGQPYLGELPDRYGIPRQSQLRPVPAGALVVAVRQMVLFANASPTGWRWIGATAARLFDAGRDPAAILTAGDMIEFCPVTADQLAKLQSDPIGGVSWDWSS